jgi:GxxExxY protein
MCEEPPSGASEEPRKDACEEPRKNAAPPAAATRNGLVQEELTGRIIRGFYAVHRELGVGYLESVYEAALARVLRDDGLEVSRQHALDVIFRGEVIGTFRADLLVERRVIVELKVARCLTNAHDAQVLNYLRGSGIEVGLLANFGGRVEFKRFVLARDLRHRVRVGPRSGPPRSSVVPQDEPPEE